MLSVQRLKVLREVAARGTIAAAAEALWVTPSAVSQQLSQLEREAGVPLLERDGRRVKLTGAGERLVTHAEKILADIEEAEADLAALGKGISGYLRTSAFPTAARALLVPVLATLDEAHPDLRVSMFDFEPEEAMPALKTGHLDLVLTYEWDTLPSIEDPGIERTLLLTEPVYVALPAGHRLAGHPVRIAELAAEEWIVGRDSTSMLDLVVSVANRAGFEPRTDLHSMDFGVILAGVAEGLGVTLVPPLALVGYRPEGIDVEPIVDGSLHRRIHAAIRRGSGGNPAIAVALAALGERAHDVERDLPRPTGDGR
jgi:DNA-binding transcriptional LysR family regulator